MISYTHHHRAFSVAAFFGASFLLHLTWENLQSPLYSCFATSSFLQCFWICLKATVTGDMLFMLTIYVALAFVHRDPFWIADRSVFVHLATWVLAVLVGVLLGISFELWAIHVSHRWTYAGMPIIPVLRIGITPVLQMIVVPLLTLYASFWLLPLPRSRS